MIELLDNLTHWHWLALGLALLAAELLGAAGYLLWLGISALLVGALLSWLPMSWQLQWVSFGVFSLGTTWLWWRRQLKQDQQGDAARTLNQKDKQLVGQVITLEDAIPAGKSRIRIADTTWSAYCEQALPEGSVVKVVDIDGITLIIKPH
ncbi:putative activity regulator of membrane protease YbbK [Vibrio ichthyoenteri ATCC 700023]|uniref:Putative activity regulator of membrane protease YbbK n=1 Tax=Vibrio ichthyoenteri ATCC 700023 TaxID=870968 RepID=F9S5A5_9VIBR|nr:NfeD family protein [Vibrio ichthyoenteri]EGU35916.1 putative activity regulator of membrane protease YbbK [Vibrio ichthyoenteri ATCC 700023]